MGNKSYRCIHCGEFLEESNKKCPKCKKSTSDRQSTGYYTFNKLMFIVLIIVLAIMAINWFKDGAKEVDQKNQKYYKCIDRETKNVNLDTFSYDMYEIEKKCIKESLR